MLAFHYFYFHFTLFSFRFRLFFIFSTPFHFRRHCRFDSDYASWFHAFIFARTTPLRRHFTIAAIASFHRRHYRFFIFLRLLFFAFDAISHYMPPLRHDIFFFIFHATLFFAFIFIFDAAPIDDARLAPYLRRSFYVTVFHFHATPFSDCFRFMHYAIFATLIIIRHATPLFICYFHLPLH
jgi:hypothetical protein